MLYVRLAKPIPMKTMTIVCLTLFFSFSSSAQNFEGKIVYRNSYRSKLTNVSDTQFAVMMGSVNEYFIKGGDYKSLWNGSILQWQVYTRSDNKIYTKMATSGAVLWKDAAEADAEIISSEFHPAAIDILGYRCDELVLTTSRGVHKYYFSKRLGADASLYTAHSFGGWNSYLSKAGALPLKMVVESEQFTVTSTAVEVKDMPLDAAFFKLPAEMSLAKSPY